jgi:hypothetical protein
MNYEYIAGHVASGISANEQLTRHIDRRTYAAIEQNRAARRVKNKRELEQRIAAMRAAFTVSVGPLPCNPATPLNARITGTVVEEGVTVEKVVFLSRPHVYVTATVYVPQGIETPAPAILFQPGHAAGGKAHPQYQQVARTIAAHGMIVMLMDPPGQGERLNYFVEGEEKPRIGGAVPDHQQFGTLFYLAGRNPVACFLSDAMRAIDYLISRGDVDPMRIGATGSSGGGTMTSVLAVMDPRVAAAAPGTFLTTRDAITVGGQLQDIEQMWPGTLAAGFDHHELIACCCPKPYLILAVDADTFPLDGTQEIYEYGRECYRLAGKPDNLKLFVDRSTHKYTLPLARAAGRFFAEVFGLPAVAVPETEPPVLSEAELAVTASGQVAWEYPDAWPMWREAQEFLKNVYRPGKEVIARSLARRLFAYDDKPTVKNLRYYAEGAGGRVRHVAWMTAPNLSVYGVLLTDKPGEKQPVTVVLLPNGLADTVAYGALLDGLLAEGRTLLVPNLSGRGNAINKHHPLTADFKADSDLIFLGDSLLGVLARDVVATCDTVREEMGELPDILAVGSAAIWAELALVAMPTVTLKTHEPLTLSSFFEDPYYNHELAFTTRARGLAKYLK